MGAPFGRTADYGLAAEPPPCTTTSMRTLPCRFCFAAAEVGWETATPAAATMAGAGGRVRDPAGPIGAVRGRLGWPAARRVHGRGCRAR
jgi:hypothetical protein